MTWLQPWAAWFVAGVPVIVLLYFLRLKRRTLPVSTLMFWQRVQQESGRSAFFRKFRHLLSLLLHLLIFLLLLGALARPVFDRGIREGSATVLILDTRARMQATEPDGRTRFESALHLARDYARQAGGGRNFALLTFAAAPAVAVPFTNDEKLLLDALTHVTPTDATGDIAAAVSLADSLLAARKGDHRIVLLTAGANGAFPKTTSELIAHNVGTPCDNVAITRFATRQLPSNPETSEVLLEMQNFGRTPVRTEVELAFDGRMIEVKPIDLAPGELRVDIFRSVPRPIRGARGWLTAKLAANDPLALDNIAYATLPPARLNRVLLVSKGNTFLEKLLSVDSSLKFQFVTPESYQPGMSEKFEAVIFDGTTPASFDLNAARGNFLFLKATPFGTKDAPLDQPVITDVDATHPTTRLASLQNVTILHAQPLALPAPHDGWTFSAPLRSAEHPLLITGERGRQRIAALAFDVLDSDLPLRVAFPLLIHGTLEWLSGSRTESAPSLAAGEVLPLPSGVSVAPVPLTAPPGPRDVQSQPAVTGFFQPLRNGFYRVTDADSQSWLAVNTFSTAESDLRGSSGKPTPVSALPTSLAALHGWPPWQWLALAAFALLTAEWCLFHRRKTE
ncbi:MAG: BatA and WFA domain-containing protein [Chthoniobacteraceae bacterium]